MHAGSWPGLERQLLEASGVHPVTFRYKPNLDVRAESAFFEWAQWCAQYREIVDSAVRSWVRDGVVPKLNAEAQFVLAVRFRTCVGLTSQLSYVNSGRDFDLLPFPSDVPEFLIRLLVDWWAAIGVQLAFEDAIEAFTQT